VGFLIYLVLWGALALWCSNDAKKRIAMGEDKRSVGGGPAAIFFVILLIPLFGSILYFIKRSKSQSSRPTL
jgi:hypothetical protein